jgi:hypothetical protein
MKVTIRRIQTGAVAASTLLVATGAGTLGCAPEDGSEEDLLGQSDDAINPGSGQLELQLGAPGTVNLQLVNSTTDEFVRVGETLKMSLPAWILWETLHPNDPLPDDARLKQLKATVKVSFVDKTTTLSSKTLTIGTWSSTIYGLYGYSSQFVIPAKTDTLKFSLTIKDALDPTAVATLTSSQISQVAVFGGDLPNKTLLFDNNLGTLRERVVDGDLLIKGSNVTLGYSDWRADQIVDKTSLNLQIGTAMYSGRFGTYEAPIYGTLVYDVAVGVSLDDGATFQPEQHLNPNTASRVLGAGRTNYEGKVKLPSTAQELLVYGHVKATLVADYSKFTNVAQKWYADGQQVLLKDAYDNPGGAFTNYVFSLQ